MIMAEANTVKILDHEVTANGITVMAETIIIITVINLKKDTDRSS